MNLSKHFTLEEATDSPTAQRMGITNTPDMYQLANIKMTADSMEVVRNKLGYPIIVNSWFRAEGLEKVLARGGFLSWCKLHDRDETDPASWTEYFQRKAHPQGFAVDFTCPMYGTPDDIAKTIAASGVEFDQLIAEGTWVHISFAPAMRREILTVKFENGVPTYTKEA